MALINCPECNKEISDSVDLCIHCSYNLRKKDNNKKTKVIIHSYNEFFVVIPNVKIFQDGNYITEIPRGETVELFIDDDTTFTFKSSIRKAEVFVSKGNTTEIMLSFNMGTGSLNAITNIKTDDVTSNNINRQTYNNSIK